MKGILSISILTILALSITSCTSSPAITSNHQTDLAITGKNWNEMTYTEKAEWTSSALHVMVGRGESEINDTIQIDRYIRELDDLCTEPSNAQRQVVWSLSELSALSTGCSAIYAIEKIQPAVVRITTPSGYGSGVIIDAAGYALTQQQALAGHCNPADGSFPVPVRLPDGQIMSGVAPADVAVAPAVTFVYDSLGRTSLAADTTVSIGTRPLIIHADSGLVQTP